MHCFNLTAPYAVLTKLVALRLECVHYRLNWAGKGVELGTFYNNESKTTIHTQHTGFHNNESSHLRLEIMRTACAFVGRRIEFVM